MGIHENWEVYKRSPYHNRYHLRDLDCVKGACSADFGCKQGDYPGSFPSVLHVLQFSVLQTCKFANLCKNVAVAIPVSKLYYTFKLLN